jgi:hypothetical protein
MKKPNPAVAISEIRPGQSIELLKELHILTRDGKLNQDTRRKLKQVYHLYQFIEPLLAGAHSLADHGAGKSYLGFILYDLFFKEKATGHIYGIESRKELVEKSRELANRLGFERMSFLDVTVEESTHSSALPEQIDVVTALHACNTATDDAIRFALTKQAKHIVLVPCCQAEVAASMRARKNESLGKTALSELWRHPIHTRELGSHLTNVLTRWNCSRPRKMPISASKPSIMAPMPSTSAARPSGARNADNEVQDIARLAAHAHRYHASVFVAFNTILRDDELEPARNTIHRLYDAGVDALIVQDMGLLEMDLPPIQLHASTQTDIRDAAKARFLQDVGFSQIVLARELTIEQIRDIAAQYGMRARILRAWRAVRSLQRPVLHQPCPHRSQRQPRRMFAGLPPALHADRRQGGVVAHDSICCR